MAISSSLFVIHLKKKSFDDINIIRIKNSTLYNVIKNVPKGRPPYNYIFIWHRGKSTRQSRRFSAGQRNTVQKLNKERADD